MSELKEHWLRLPCAECGEVIRKVYVQNDEQLLDAQENMEKAHLRLHEKARQAQHIKDLIKLLKED